jgi:hypothetical protein
MRNLTSYPLNFSKENKRDFLHQVLELYWEYSGRYYFLSNNCATEALTLLHATVRDHQFLKRDAMTPNKLFRVLRDEGLISEERAITVDSYWPKLETIYSKVASIIGITTLEKYWELTAKQRALYIEKATNAQSTHLYALLSIENAKAFEKSTALQKKIGLEIHLLEENDKTKKLALRAVDITNFLTYGAGVDTGYGIPTEDDLITQDIEVSISELEAELLQANNHLGQWAQGRLTELLTEIQIISQNQKRLMNFIGRR